MMRERFINRGLISAIFGCSAFVVFASTFGTLALRQQEFVSSMKIRMIENRCHELEGKNLALMARIAQLQAPYYLKQKVDNLLFANNDSEVVKVQNWNEYRGTSMDRSALAMSTPKNYAY